MEYRVLGALEVRRDDKPVDLGPFRPRALLALLLTQPNSVFSTDQIIDGLWGDEAGADKQNSLWVFVSGLRKALEPEREKRTDGTVLLTRSPGYLVSVEADEVDSIRFEKLVAEGRALADTDPAAASLVLGEALALWRGRPFEDFTYESAFQAEIARLSELRVGAVEARIDADLKRGMARELVSELESLSREHPLRERITGQLMMALYRSGRQAEAMRAYQLLKSRLGEELGIDPSGAVRRLEEQIVTADPALDSPRATARAGSETEPGLAVRGGTSCARRSARAPSVSRTGPTNRRWAAKSRSKLLGPSLLMTLRSSAASKPRRSWWHGSSIPTSFRSTTIGESRARPIS